MPRQTPSKLPLESGIALGPILFVLAILGILGAVMSAGGGGFSQASTADRVVADIVSQANLIRSKISECNLMYGSASNYDGYPSSDTTNGTLVSAVTCTGDPSGQQNLWTGNRPTNYPPATQGFNNWYYINTNASGLGGTATGGRCIWIEPTASNGGNIEGLKRAAKKFTNATANDGAAEVNFNPASTRLRFIVWISSPPTAGSESSKCTPQ
jgi:type II secretory pathway pseudopilin PulG